jgi:hypothetical protein
MFDWENQQHAIIYRIWLETIGGLYSEAIFKDGE